MHILCPHCRNPIEVVKLSTHEEIACPSCGSSFRLESDITTGAATSSLQKIGRFELTSVLGHGAFGTVYKAHDIELDRTVAVKVPRAGNLVGAQELDRFLREARSAGQLRHPSIVTVHEVGQRDGLPYLVSDFVQGVTLTDLLSARRPGYQEAAELVAAVADALQYAHEQGVVHRDVKPSNIMVGDDGKPCVMDFGLAKREAGEITMTVEGQVLGTPAYMAPEQAKGEGHAVDGRADVYSLGVVLYQLLTGELPFRGTPRMLLHQVLHDEPRPPRSLNDRIPRDLETVCLKAMAKEPGRRFRTARDCAADLRRWLNGEPIVARPVATAERLWRWCRRNPRVAGLSAAVLTLLVTVVVVSTAMAVRISKEHADAVAAGDLARLKADDEEVARKLAERHAEDARKAREVADANAKVASEQRKLSLDTLYSVVTEVDQKLRDRPDMLALRQELLKTAMAGLEKVSRTAENATFADRSVGVAFQRMGDIYLAAGKSIEGRKQYQLSLPIFERLMVSDPDEDWNRWNAAISYTTLGDISRQLGEPAEAARAQYLKGLSLREELIAKPRQGGPPPPTGPLLRKQALAISYAKLGSLAEVAGDPAGGRDWYLKALELSRELAAADPKNLQFRQSLAGSCLLVGGVCFSLRDEAGARAYYGQALDLRKQLAAEDPQNVRYQTDVASAYATLGDLDLYLGHAGRALELYETAHAIYEGLAKKDRENPELFSSLATSFYRLGTARLGLKDGSGADRDYRESLRLKERLAKADPASISHKVGIMLAQARCGRHAEAANTAEELAKQGTKDANMLLRAAGGYALAVAGVAHGKSPAEVTPADREQQQRYAEAAISVITQAVAVGYKDVVELELSPDLLPLHAFPAYQELLAKFRAK
jgi:serine/threonine-protein kinase